MGDKMGEFTVTATQGVGGRYGKPSGRRGLGLISRRMRKRFAGEQVGR